MDDQQQIQQPQFTKKERQKVKSQEKQLFVENRERERRNKKIIRWIATIVIVAGLGYGVFYLSSQPQKTRPGEAFPILGQEHIEVGEEHPPYNSNPPTSGWHYAEAAPWGIYQEPLPNEQLIHNLEHGGIWISYKPDIDQETKSQLESIVEQFPRSTVITPREENDANIAIASWGRLLKLESFDETPIIEFIKANLNKSPEPFAR